MTSCVVWLVAMLPGGDITDRFRARPWVTHCMTKLVKITRTTSPSGKTS